MRTAPVVLVACLLGACAMRPDVDDAFARAQAMCGETTLVDDAAPGWTEYSVRQHDRQNCLSRETVRKGSDAAALRKAFDESVPAR
ncbi:MAG: hypothetical protein AAFX10_02370 [Pseudomonadota bacterium]